MCNFAQFFAQSRTFLFFRCFFIQDERNYEKYSIA